MNPEQVFTLAIGKAANPGVDFHRVSGVVLAVPHDRCSLGRDTLGVSPIGGFVQALLGGHHGLHLQTMSFVEGQGVAHLGLTQAVAILTTLQGGVESIPRLEL